jgi:ribonuclease P protein component
MARIARQQGYSRRHRFSRRGSFGPVLRGSRKVRGKLAVLHTIAAHGACSRLGVALTKRLVASSHERTRLKRLVRELFRRHPVKQHGLDCVLTLKARYDWRQEHDLTLEVQSLFDRAVTLAVAA